MKFLFNLLFENWEFIAPLIYEFIVRIWPTKWNISILDNIWKLINYFIPNKRVPDGNEIIAPPEPSERLNSGGIKNLKNLIKVKVGRHILRSLIILFLFSGICNAQIWQNFKGVRLVNNSDTTLQLSVQGSIFYDNVNNIFWGRDNWGWKNLLSGGSSGIDGTLIADRIPVAVDANTLTSTNFGYFQTVSALQLHTQSVDANDDQTVTINSAGTGGASITRGAYIELNGNETGSNAGDVNIVSGDVGGINLNATEESNFFVSGNVLNVNADTTIFRNGTGEKISVDGNFTRIVFTSDAQRVSFITHSAIDNSLQIGRGGTNLITIDDSNNIIFPALPADCTGAPSGALANVSGTVTVCP